MKYVFNWTVGSFFRTIGRIFAYIIIGTLVAFAFTYKPKALSLTPRSTYGNDTNNYGTPSEINGFGSNNTYSYSTNTPSVQGKWYWGVASTGTAVSGKAWALSMGFVSNLNAQTYYDLTINFRDRDLRSNVNTSSIELFSGSSTASLDDTGLSLIGVVNNATTSSNTNQLIIRFYTTEAISIWGVSIFSNTGGSDDNITSVNNFGISSASIEVVDITNSDAIINNQTNNTQNIINNQNNTTQQIIDNQNELLGSQCANLFDSSTIVAGDITGSYSSVRGSSRQNIYLSAGTYYFRTNISNGYQYAITINDVNYPPLSAYPQYVYDSTWISSLSKSFTINSPGWFVIQFRKSNNGNITLSEIKDFNYMLSKEDLPYCKFGSYSSKLDDVNSSINDLNSSINDDDTSSATNQAGNFFSNFSTNTHGLTSIITAPLSAIQSLTSATCTPIVLPIPFVNQNLTLPCMRPIYVDNFGSFMSLYDTITLGIVSYWVLVRIFALVKDFKNPEHDEVEVMDL